MPSLYTYSVTQDLGGVVNVPLLHNQIVSNESILTDLEYTSLDGDTISIKFMLDISNAEEMALENIISAHDGNQSYDNDTDQAVSGTGYDLFEVYDSVGGQRTSNSTGITIILDAVKQNTNPSSFSYDDTSGILTILQDGIYVFKYRFSADSTSGTRAVNMQIVEEDRGSGYYEIPGVRSFTYHRTSACGKDTGSAEFSVNAVAGYTYRLINKRVTGGTTISLANGTSLMVHSV